MYKYTGTSTSILVRCIVYSYQYTMYSYDVYLVLYDVQGTRT